MVKTRHEVTARLAVAVASIVATCLGFELAARAIPAILPIAVRHELGLTRARSQVVKGDDHVEEYVNPLDQVTWHVRRDDHGFRRLPSEKLDEQPVGVVVGDSFSFCWGVEASDC